MKVLLSGCTGFIGARLTSRLVEQGHECFLIVRHGSTHTLDQLSPSIHVVSGESLPEFADAVINLAGEPIAGRWTESKKSRILQSRIVSTQNLVTWMLTRQRPPHAFLSASAVGFYGSRGDELITESTPQDPKTSFLSEVCRQWEEEANRAQTIGVQVVNLRLSNLMDSAGGFLAKLRPMIDFSPVYPALAPNAYLPWVSLDDVVGAIDFLLTRDVSGPVNVVSSSEETYREFYRALARVKGRLSFGSVPDWIVRMLFGEFSEALISSQRISPGVLLENNFSFQNPDLEPFLRSNLSKS